MTIVDVEAKDGERSKSIENLMIKRYLEELNARVKRLEEYENKADAISDPGPIMDCVVFHDGTHWRAAIDVSETGLLCFSCSAPLTDFRVEHQWSTFDDAFLLNYGVNIYNGGNLLSIVADSGAHGTHVAGIIAAHHEEGIFHQTINE